MGQTLHHISPSPLSNLLSRISYLRPFLELTSSDTEALVATKLLIAPLIPSILDAVYTKLRSYNIHSTSFRAEEHGVPKRDGEGCK